MGPGPEVAAQDIGSDSRGHLWHRRRSPDLRNGRWTIYVGFPSQHAGVIHEITRGKVVSAIDDDVKVADDGKRVVAAEPRLESANLDKGINRLYLLGSRI